jgi:hypothetical protein
MWIHRPANRDTRVPMEWDTVAVVNVTLPRLLVPSQDRSSLRRCARMDEP